MSRGSGTVPSISFEDVRQLQELLQKRGYDVGRIDGVLGLKSREAIRDVQIKFGLPADGWPTAELLTRLGGTARGNVEQPRAAPPPTGSRTGTTEPRRAPSQFNPFSQRGYRRRTPRPFE